MYQFLFQIRGFLIQQTLTIRPFLVTALTHLKNYSTFQTNNNSTPRKKHDVSSKIEEIHHVFLCSYQ